MSIFKVLCLVSCAGIIFFGGYLKNSLGALICFILVFFFMIMGILAEANAPPELPRQK